MGQKYAAYDAQGAVYAFFDSIDSPVPNGTDVVKVTQEQWLQCLSQRGWTVSGGILVAPPAPSAEELLAVAQAAQTALMEQEYQTAISQDVSYTSAGSVTKTFQADSNSRDILNTTLNVCKEVGAVPSGFWWKASDNTHVPFTLADLAGLSSAMFGQGWTAFQRLDARKSSIATATTVAQVQAIVW